MKLSLERLARRIAELGGDGGSSMLILTLASDPLLTPTAGALSQFGTYGGNLYIHLTAATDTNWLELAGLTSGLPVLTLGADPTLTPTAGAMSQFGNAAGHLYLHLTGEADTNWFALTTMIHALPVLPLGNDPTVTPTSGQVSQFGTYKGELFQHLAGGTDREWLSISSLFPAYTPTFADLTEGEMTFTLTMTDATVYVMIKTAAQIRAAAIAQGLGALTTGLVSFPHADIEFLLGKTIATSVPALAVATVPFRATGGLRQAASFLINVSMYGLSIMTTDTALDGTPQEQPPAIAYTFTSDVGECMQLVLEFHGMSRF